MSSVLSNGYDCDKLEIGNFYFYYVNAWPVSVDAQGNYRKNKKRHGEIVIYGFQDIPGGLDLYLTDRAWSSETNSFVANTVEHEGIVVYRTPYVNGIPTGLAFGMGNNALVKAFKDNWTDVDVNWNYTGGATYTDTEIDADVVNRTVVNTSQYFDLEMDGDQVFLYCVDSKGKDRPIAAFSYGEPFLRHSNNSTNLTDYDYGTNTSAAPAYFYENSDLAANGVNATLTSKTPGLLEMRTPGKYGDRVFLNWEYRSPCGSGCVMDFYDLRNTMGNAVNHWIGYNPDNTYDYPPSSANALGTGGSHSWMMANGFGMVLLVWLLVR